VPSDGIDRKRTEGSAPRMSATARLSGGLSKMGIGMAGVHLGLGGEVLGRQGPAQ
jgi:hypothetical protein